MMQAEDWRPIETAPKDGTNVRLWIDSEKHPETHGRWVRTGPYGCWYDNRDTIVDEPTHWQPIVGPVLATVPADTKPAADIPHCPYTLVPMPVNADGRGPEMDPAKVVRTDWEVWDELNRCVAVIRETEGV